MLVVGLKRLVKLWSVVEKIQIKVSGGEIIPDHSGNLYLLFIIIFSSFLTFLTRQKAWKVAMFFLFVLL